MPDTKQSPDGPASAPAAEPETLAAILADYRADIPAMTSRELTHPTPEYLRILLDRIEAAAKRERASLQSALLHCKQYAQKIERENEEGETRLDAEEIIATVDNEFAGIRPERAPGNAAAMRDLLEKIRREYGWGLIGCRTCISSETDVERVSDLFEKQIDASLAAPARNCDRPGCKTERGARETWWAEEIRPRCDGEAMDHDEIPYSDWLFAEAKGGKE